MPASLAFEVRDAMRTPWRARRAQVPKRRPRPWLESGRQGRTRYVWRFEGQRYRTRFYDDPRKPGRMPPRRSPSSCREPGAISPGPGCRWRSGSTYGPGLLDDIEPTTIAKYRYLVEFHILPHFQGRELGSLTFEEIEAWDRAIPTRISARGRPYARSVAAGARSLLITILGDAVHAGRSTGTRRNGAKGAAAGCAPGAAHRPAAQSSLPRT